MAITEGSEAGTGPGGRPLLACQRPVNGRIVQGSWAGYSRHLRAGEKACEPCMAAMRAYQREAKNRKPYDGPDYAILAVRIDVALQLLEDGTAWSAVAPKN